MVSGIYKIVNPKGEIYIGQSQNIKERKQKYKRNNTKSQPLIYESINKYGWENHSFEILEYTSKTSSREKYWINFYDSCNKGLNKNLGGGGPKYYTKESRKKMSLAKKGKLTEEHINSIKIANSKPKPHISKLHKGKPSSMKGKSHTIETRKKMSLAKKGKTYEEIYGIIKGKELKLNRSLPRKGKDIICLNTKQTFDSIKSTSKVLNLNPRSISNILNGRAKQTRNGLIFKYVS